MKENTLKKIVRRYWIARIIWAIFSLLKKDSYLIQVGWFNSIGRRFEIYEESTLSPWFTYAAVSFLENRLNKEMSIFEFGSGNSTLWWSQRVKNVVSVDHDLQWYSHLKNLIPANVEYLHYEMKPGGEYSKSVKNYENTFDIIAIDGRDRVNCVKNSISALKPDGIVIWDNSDREKYRDGYAFLLEKGFKRLDFEGMGHFWAVGWCTSIFYRSNNCLNI